jgi:quinoprotein glucose dehydrogenase
MASLASSRKGAGGWAVLLLGLVLALIGLVLTIGGAWLALLGGSPYYVLAGLGLLVSGVLLARRRALGAWIYIAVFGLTVLWALWEAGLNGWALVPRVIAPAVLLVLVLAALPVVDPGPPGRRKSLVGFAALAVFLIVGGVVVVAAAGRRRLAGLWRHLCRPALFAPDPDQSRQRRQAARVG